VPDFYHRLGRGVRTSFRDAAQRMISLHHLDPAAQEEVLKPMRSQTDAQVVEDTGALIRFLGADAVACSGAMGAIGLCTGGRHVMQVAGHHPANFVASACLHGMRLVGDDADSPHRLADRFRGELYCGFGEKDHCTPPPLVAGLAEALRDHAVAYRFAVHRAAERGHALPDRDIYDKQAANRDWGLIFAMFRRQLRP